MFCTASASCPHETTRDRRQIPQPPRQLSFEGFV
jgi:hypothetical protein